MIQNTDSGARRTRSLRSLLPCLLLGLTLTAATAPASAETLLLRQPALSERHVAFIYASDLWIAERGGGEARRLTSTPAIESHPHFSPDGQQLAFSSNRSGTTSVYVLPIEGGSPQRLTWYPSSANVRGFTPDGDVLYASSRGTAPTGYDRLWTVSTSGGPSERLTAPWGHSGSYSPDGQRIAIDRMSRWDVEWRNYRGGQNTPLILLDLDLLGEVAIPSDQRSTDVQPLWLGDTVYFLSDRGGTMNVWTYGAGDGALEQLTDFTGSDVKWLSGYGDTLILEREGALHLLPAAGGDVSTLDITARGDFPWSETRWEDVSRNVRGAALSPTGKRAVFSARGDIFTVPVEKGSPRNLTRSPGAADRAPAWSPDGQTIAWFSDDGDGYELLLADQDGLGEPRSLDVGASKMAWEVTWSPDGERIAFVDDDVRVRIVELEGGTVTTADAGGTNLERGNLGLTWSPDGKYLAYAKTFPNLLRRAVIWSVEDGQARPVTDPMADVISPEWDRGGKYLYLLASTDVALRSGWANTSTIRAPSPTYAAYAVLLTADLGTPFELESDEEPTQEEPEAEEDSDTPKDGYAGKKGKGKKSDKEPDEKPETEGEGEDDNGLEPVKIDFDGIERRIVALPIDSARYRGTLSGPAGSVFILEARDGGPPGLVMHKFDLEKREASEFLSGVWGAYVSHDGQKLLVRQGPSWSVVGTGGPPKPGDGGLDLNLQMKLDRSAEWEQIFDEAWRYQRDFFYDPNLHGRDWNVVRQRYEPLLPHVKHRSDLNYVLDQMNGELSVGHSFVFGGDLPDTDDSAIGLLGADFIADGGRWKIERIYTYESWNPNVQAPLDVPGLGVEEGHYLVGVNGVELTADEDPYELFDGTVGQQTTLHVNDAPQFEGARTVTVEPIRSENGLRRRAWIEDNRRRVDELSGGRLAYVWVPNTSTPGVVDFDRYFFAQQDKEGAVIDERFNGGGLLDDYMVDLMTRKLRAAITNEVPNGAPMRLPAGLLGPKVLLINEYAGSGGDFFPWVFRQQQAGPLIGMRTWGGLVKSSVHYPFVDGGAMTAPDNAIFDPNKNEWIGENVGIPPDIEVQIDALAAAEGRDPQLERGVEELMKLLPESPPGPIQLPPFPRPAVSPPN
ncbi:MAG: PDZ domain-containing protein [Acidobacteriota bacterium]